jgi:hypothetical protein
VHKVGIKNAGVSLRLRDKRRSYQQQALPQIQVAIIF